MAWIRKASIGVLPLVLSACGQSVILASPTERVVRSFVFSHTGFRPGDVSCPSGVPAKAGERFQCRFTGPDGKYIAYLQVTRVSGTRVDYEIQSERVGVTINPSQAERLVAGFVARHAGVHPRDLRCPAGVVPLVGRTLTCHFKAPDGSYTASLTVTSTDMGKVGYRITTRRTG